MDDSQNLLGGSLQRFLTERYTDAVRRSIIRSEAGWSAEIWAELADLGFLGAFISERTGGLAVGPSDLMSIMQAFGRSLVVEPFVSTAVIGGSLFSRLEWVEGANDVRSGKMRLALAHDEKPFGLGQGDIATSAKISDRGYVIAGHKIVVRDAPCATHLIVSAVIGERGTFSLFLVPAEAACMTIEGYPLIDGARAADVQLSGTVVPKSSLLASGVPALSLLRQLLNDATVAICAEAIGVMRAMLEQTIAYMSQRLQFGKPLSSFQALQHRMADMLVEVEQACSLTYRAALAHDDSSAVSAAKIRVNEALRAVSHGAVQLHGGIGTTDEIVLSQYFRRAAAIERQYGSSSEHYRRFEQRLLHDIDASAGATVHSEAQRQNDGQQYSLSV